MAELRTIPKPYSSDVRAALKEGIRRLRDANVPSHTLAAELLLMHALGCDRTWLYSHPDAPIEPDAAEKYFALIERRAAGEPTQYLVGKQEFWGLEFEVNPQVLIPRPETEHVIEVALACLPRAANLPPRAGHGVSEPIRLIDADLPQRVLHESRVTSHESRSSRLRIADIGTGSGCIAVALARELPHAEIIATDISPAALEVARRNAAQHGVSDRIRFIETDLLEEVPRESRLTNHGLRSFALIVSNPPYISRGEAEMLPREVHEHEPHAALFAGPIGTEIYSRLIDQAASALLPGGILVLELGYNSASHVHSLLAGNPAWTAIAITNDLAGIPRVISAQRTQEPA